jgi:hypothetical protein
MSAHGFPPARHSRLHDEPSASSLYTIVNKKRMKWTVRSIDGWPINDPITLIPQREGAIVEQDCHVPRLIRGPPGQSVLS